MATVAWLHSHGTVIAVDACYSYGTGHASAIPQSCYSHSTVMVKSWQSSVTVIVQSWYSDGAVMV